MQNVSMILEGSVAERWPRGAERSRLPLISSPRFVPQKPTTGLLAITLALHLCDLVHIAGFGYPDAHHKKQSIHYYEYITLKSMVVSGPCWRTGDPEGVRVVPEIAHREVTQRVRAGTKASGLPGQRPLYSVFLPRAGVGNGAPGVWAYGEGQVAAWEFLSWLPWLSPQWSGHNVSQEALAIKRMLEIGAVKNLTYF